MHTPFDRSPTHTSLLRDKRLANHSATVTKEGHVPMLIFSYLNFSVVWTEPEFSPSEIQSIQSIPVYKKNI